MGCYIWGVSKKWSADVSDELLLIAVWQQSLLHLPAPPPADASVPRPGGLSKNFKSMLQQSIKSNEFALYRFIMKIKSTRKKFIVANRPSIYFGLQIKTQKGLFFEGGFEGGFFLKRGLCIQAPNQEHCWSLCWKGYKKSFYRRHSPAAIYWRTSSYNLVRTSLVAVISVLLGTVYWQLQYNQVDTWPRLAVLYTFSFYISLPWGRTTLAIAPNANNCPLMNH
jgi:hypothetical protein